MWENGLYVRLWWWWWVGYFSEFPLSINNTHKHTHRLQISTYWEVFHLCHVLCEWMKRHTCHLTVNTHSCVFRYCWRQACRNLCMGVLPGHLVWLQYCVARASIHTNARASTSICLHSTLHVVVTEVFYWCSFIFSLLVTWLIFFLSLSLLLFHGLLGKLTLIPLKRSTHLYLTSMQQNTQLTTLRWHWCIFLIFGLIHHIYSIAAMRHGL